MKRQPADRTRQAVKTGQPGQPPAPQTAVEKRARRKVAAKTGRVDSGNRITPEEYHRMVAATAYYRAEQRGFTGGRELEDWLAAEAEINRLLEEHDQAVFREGGPGLVTN